MVHAEDVGAVLEALLEQSDGLVQTARSLVCVCEVVTHTERLRVVHAEDVGAVLEALLEQSDGFVCTIQPLVFTCEVAA